MDNKKSKSRFKRVCLEKFEFHSASFKYNGGSNPCETTEAKEKNSIMSRKDSRCGKWE